MDSNMDSDALTTDNIASAERLLRLEFTPKEREQLLATLAEQRRSFEALRKIKLRNYVPPALHFVPAPDGAWPRGQGDPTARPDASPAAGRGQRPDNLEDFAFCTIGELGSLLRDGIVTSIELTRMYLNRLKRYNAVLNCVITLTEELALEQARRADDELARGITRGPLHGIPYGAKDLLATKGIPTTWGAAPFEQQVFDRDAAVIRLLEQAGAVLVAKLSLGELAMDDVWFGGQTKTPWNVSQGSSGSSAGSSAATSAGLVGFSIGSETLGSILAPCCRCAVSGLRPTFGRVSRSGAMSLSWSMDKIGPICRSVEDCALVLCAMCGPLEGDLEAAPLFAWPAEVRLEDLRVGYVRKAFEAERATKPYDDAVLTSLQRLGIDLIPIELPDYPLEAMTIILFAEAAAAFDELTRSNQDDLLMRQGAPHWPNMLRAARFIPAVEYIQANRVRTLLMRDMARLMESLDVYLCPSSFETNTILANLTGQPTACVPNGFTADNKPIDSIMTFTGRLYGEAEVLTLARAFQEASGLLEQYPLLDELSRPIGSQ